MFDSYSMRARQVIFLARLESGARGAKRLDAGDLIVGLINEDQNQFASALASFGTGGQLMVLPSHEPYLQKHTASAVLRTVQQSLPQAHPMPTSADMPMSVGLREILSKASALREKLQSKEVTPLHLLAVLVSEPQKGIEALREVGITEEEIVKAIQERDP